MRISDESQVDPKQRLHLFILSVALAVFLLTLVALLRFADAVAKDLIFFVIGTTCMALLDVFHLLLRTFSTAGPRSFATHSGSGSSRNYRP
jgi:hypothetical protein